MNRSLGSRALGFRMSETSSQDLNTLLTTDIQLYGAIFAWYLISLVGVSEKRGSPMEVPSRRSTWNTVWL